jgi:hypothetical protein
MQGAGALEDHLCLVAGGHGMDSGRRPRAHELTCSQWQAATGAMPQRKSERGKWAA